jgi:hypothetical protein
MSEQPPSRPPAHEQAGTSGLLGQVLSFIDKPWKVAALVILFVVGGAGWIVYEKREQLLESWLTPSAVTLKASEVPAALEKLVELTGADLIQIWEVDLGANVQRFIGARRHDGQRPVIPEPRRLPVITARSDVQILVDVLGGRPACADISAKTHSPVVARLADRGFKRGCAVPIPPGPEAFVGIIYMAWVTAPEASVEDVAVQAAREIAAKLDQ